MKCVVPFHSAPESPVFWGLFRLGAHGYINTHSGVDFRIQSHSSRTASLIVWLLGLLSTWGRPSAAYCWYTSVPFVTPETLHCFPAAWETGMGSQLKTVLSHALVTSLESPRGSKHTYQMDPSWKQNCEVQFVLFLV